MLSRILIYYKTIITTLVLLLLSACGDSCYDDVNTSDNGPSYLSKTYYHELDGKEKSWYNTGIKINHDNTFTIANVDGTVTACANPNSPNSCAIGYTTMCDGGKKYICNDTSCQSTTLVNYCANQSNCTQSDSCGPNKLMCKNGLAYNYVNGTWKESGSSCVEAVFCDQNTKKMRFVYSIGTGKDAKYITSDKVIGTCAPNEIKCANGHAHPVSAKESLWTEIDSKILPGDDIYLRILPPKTGTAKILSLAVDDPSLNSLAVGDPSLNSWSSSNNMRYTPGQYEGCPTSVPLDVKKSSYTQCPFLDKGYYTCPLCEGNGRHRGINAPIWKQCNQGGLYLQCWYVGGSGLWLKIINDTEDCNAEAGCSDESKCIWFDQYTGSNISTKFGLISYQPVTDSGYGCRYSQDMSMCNNRSTIRHMTGADGSKTKICAKIADLNAYEDNIGGYTVYATRKSCIGRNGRPSKASSYTNIDHIVALEYIVSSSTPQNTDLGIPMTENVVYPHAVNAGKSGNLYIRVRDSYYGDNTGSYNVKIQYKEYVSGGLISSLIEDLKNILRDMTLSASVQYFHNISCIGSACECVDGANCNSQYVDYIRSLLILYIAGYGIAFLIGAVQISQMDLLIRVMKIGMVLTLISPNSFDFFYNNFFDLFLDGMDDLIKKSQSGFSMTSDSGNVFSFVDNMISITFLSKTTWLKLLGLIFTSPMGMILAILLIVGVLLFLLGIFKAIVVYLMATLVIGILILLAPIFIPFALFKTTNHLFENWIKMFAQYALEPVILLIGLGVLTQLAYILFIEIINFHVCWKCMWPINFAFLPSVTKALSLTDTIFCIQFFGPFGVMPTGGSALLGALGIQIVDIILFVIIGHLMLGFDTLVQQMVLRITGGEAAQFKYADKIQNFSSAGSAVLHKTGLAGLANMASKSVQSQAKRAALKAFGPKSEEDKLLQGAKQTDAVHAAQISANSRSLSNNIGNVLDRNCREETAKIQNQGLPSSEKELAAKNIGKKLYESVGNTEEFKGFVSNLSKLSSIETDSLAHSKLTPQARGLHSTLQGKSATEALETLSRADSALESKKEAMGTLSETIYKEAGEAHAMLHNSENLEFRNKIIQEINNLERAPQTSFRRGVPK